MPLKVVPRLATMQRPPFLVQAVLGWLVGLPPVTRVIVCLSVTLTIACSLEIIHPLRLYYHPRLCWAHGQWWRVLTTFLFFGEVRDLRDALHLLLNVVFVLRYARSLESASFAGRPADFLWMLLLGGAGMLAAVSAGLVPGTHLFLSHSLGHMVLYVWARRHPQALLNLMGVLTFAAPWLPWVLTGFHCLLGGRPWGHLLGIAAGHLYWYLDEVAPLVLPRPHRRLLRAPWPLRAALGQAPPGARPPPHFRVLPGALRFGGGLGGGDERER